MNAYKGRLIMLSMLALIITWVLGAVLTLPYYTKTQSIIFSLLIVVSVELYLINTRRKKQSKFIAILGILLIFLIFISSSYVILKLPVTSIFLILIPPFGNVLLSLLKILIIILNFSISFRISFELWFGKIGRKREVEHE